MYHSITIGELDPNDSTSWSKSINTWDDWHLIPTSRPLVNPPQVKTNYVQLPGGDGILDLTTSLAGRPTYGNRSGSWEFRVMNGYQEWSILYSEIMAYLHGQEFVCVLEDDPAYFYHGRFSVNQWRSDKTHSIIVINYNLDPYKKEIDAGDGDWLWDPFNFETGVIKDYNNIQVNGTRTVLVINNDMMEIVPIFLCTAAMTVEFDGDTYSLVKGTNSLARIRLAEGENNLTFTGNGYVTIQTRGGRF